MLSIKLNCLRNDDSKIKLLNDEQMKIFSAVIDHLNGKTKNKLLGIIHEPGKTCLSDVINNSVNTFYGSKYLECLFALLRV